MRLTSVVILTLFLVNAAFAQRTSAELRKLVLEQNVVDSTYTFDRSYPPDLDIIQLTLLGDIKLSNDQSVKILNSAWTWGADTTTTSRIIILDQDNNFLGDYNFYGFDKLPKRISNENLIFSYVNEETGVSKDTSINFRDGPPKVFEVNGLGKYYYKPL